RTTTLLPTPTPPAPPPAPVTRMRPGSATVRLPSPSQPPSREISRDSDHGANSNARGKKEYTALNSVATGYTREDLADCWRRYVRGVTKGRRSHCVHAITD